MTIESLDLCEFCDTELAEYDYERLEDEDVLWCTKCIDRVEEHRENDHDLDEYEDCPLCDQG
jgi:hypothetical protein